jgi:hypothetical protein
VSLEEMMSRAVKPKQLVCVCLLRPCAGRGRSGDTLQLCPGRGKREGGHCLALLRPMHAQGQ